MDVAVRFFAEKGYHATSIQEIADALGIAKGALYFYFKSKEDLLVQIVRHHLTKFVEEFIAIMEDSTRDPRSKLMKQIILKSERLSDNRDFIDMFINERFEVNEELFVLLRDLQGEMMIATAGCIEELYGEEAKPYANDLAIMFGSISDGYLGMFHTEQALLNLNELAEFLVNRLDDMVKGMLVTKPDPIVNKIMTHRPC